MDIFGQDLGGIFPYLCSELFVILRLPASPPLDSLLLLCEITDHFTAALKLCVAFLLRALVFSSFLSQLELLA